MTDIQTAFTPKRASSLLEIEVYLPIVDTASGNIFMGALFQDSGVNAIALSLTAPTKATYNNHYLLKFIVAASNTTARTYKFRFGPQTTGTVYSNRTSGMATAFGLIQQSYMKITEIAQP